MNFVASLSHQTWLDLAASDVADPALDINTVKYSSSNRTQISVYTVSQKNVPPLQLAIIFTYTVRLRQFVAKMLPRK